MSISRLFLIIRREYLSTVGKRSFIILTLLMPLLFLLLCGLPALLSEIKSDELKNVFVVDASRHYGALLHDTDEYHFVTLAAAENRSLYEWYTTSNNDDRDAVYAILSIPEYVDSLASVSIYSSQSLAPSLETTVSEQLTPELRNVRLAPYISESAEEIMTACNARMEVKSIKWSDEGKENLSETMISQILGMFLALLTYTFVLIYGAMVMNGVIEEKTNRIVEVIISSCRPMELMLGKIIGVALVGLTQIAIWGAMIMVGISILGLQYGAMSAETTQVVGEGNFAEIMQNIAAVDWGGTLFCFVLYFVGGYLLYAALFAAFGSAVDQANDASQFTMPVTTILIFALYAGIYSSNNPDGPLAWWCSLIPFTSPIVMMCRLPYDVPMSELVFSIVLLFATALGITYLAGKIYRTGILMYGRKFSFAEILRWMQRKE